MALHINNASISSAGGVEYDRKSNTLSKISPNYLSNATEATGIQIAKTGC